MISVSEAYKRAIYGDARSIAYRITINGSETYDQTKVNKMVLEESAGNSQNSPVGVAYTSTLSVVLRQPKEGDYEGAMVLAESGVTLSDGTIEWIPLGVFEVSSAVSTDNYQTVNLTCVDKMGTLDGKYETALNYPAALQDVANEIAEQAGLEIVTPDGGWANMLVRIKPTGMMLRDAIGYVAGCQGGNARIGRDGKLEIAKYKVTGEKIPRRVQYMGGITRTSSEDVSIGVTLEGNEELYPIDIKYTESGSIVSTPSLSAKAGEIVILGVTAFYGYELAELLIVDDNGNTITATPNAEGSEYTFIQGECGVSVYGSFKSTESSLNTVSLTVNGDGVVEIKDGVTSFAEGEYVDIILSDASTKEHSIEFVPSNIDVSYFVDATGDGWYSFIMPSHEVSVTITFVENETLDDRLKYTNPFITKSAVDEISGNFDTISYTPAEVKYRGNPALQAGDSVIVEDDDGNEHTVLIMRQRLTFGGGMHGEITSSAPSQERRVASAQQQSKIEQIANEAVKTYETQRSVVAAALSRGLSSTVSRVSAQGATIESLVEWRGTASASIASIKQQADANGASISLIVQDGEVQGGVVIDAINGETSAKIEADRLDIEGKELNIKVAAVNVIGDLSVSRLTGGVNNEPIIMTNFTARDGGSIAGFNISADGLSVETTTTGEEKEIAIESSFQAGVSYRGDALGISTIRNWGVSTAWYNKAYNVTDAQTIYVDGLPGSNCEVFILAKLPTSADSVSESSDTSKAIITYFHESAPGTYFTINTQDSFEGAAYLVINSSTSITPTVTVVPRIHTGTFFLDNNGNISIPDKSGNYIFIGPSTQGIQIGQDASSSLRLTTDMVYHTVEDVQYNAIGFAVEDGDFVGTLYGTWYINRLGSATEVTSDRTKKYDISEQAEIYSRIFDRLIPVSYKYIDGTSGRTHLGLIAQDIENALSAEGMSTMDFAPLTYTVSGNGEKTNYGIRYDELVSMCIYEIQRIKKTLEGN